MATKEIVSALDNDNAKDQDLGSALKAGGAFLSIHLDSYPARDNTLRPVSMDEPFLLIKPITLAPQYRPGWSRDETQPISVFFVT